MAKTTIMQCIKLKKLCATLDLPFPHVLGHLELIWITAHEQASPLFRYPEDVEIAAQWNGEPGVLVAALSREEHRFLDPGRKPGHFVIHDYLDHAPRYVIQRIERAQKAALRMASSSGADSEPTGDESAPLPTTQRHPAPPGASTAPTPPTNPIPPKSQTHPNRTKPILDPSGHAVPDTTAPLCARLVARISEFADGAWLSWFSGSLASMAVIGDDLLDLASDLDTIDADIRKASDTPGKKPTIHSPSKWLVKRLTTGTPDMLPLGGWLLRLNLYWADFPATK